MDEKYTLVSTLARSAEDIRFDNWRAYMEKNAPQNLSNVDKLLLDTFYFETLFFLETKYTHECLHAQTIHPEQFFASMKRNVGYFDKLLGNAIKFHSINDEIKPHYSYPTKMYEEAKLFTEDKADLDNMILEFDMSPGQVIIYQFKPSNVPYMVSMASAYMAQKKIVVEYINRNEEMYKKIQNELQ